jgi:putative oxidoreductase
MVLMFRRLVATDRDAASFVARLILGFVMFPHGAQHALGWFGGYGFHGTLGWMTGTLGIPAFLAGVAIVTELVAPVALVIGLCGRLAATGIFALMLVAASTHVANGFFMNWFGTLKPGSEGFEYHLLAMTAAMVVVIRGSGALSVDYLLSRRPRQPQYRGAVLTAAESPRHAT